MRGLLADRPYRWYAFVLVLTGMSGSAGMPLMSLFLIQELGASLEEAAMTTVAGLLGVAVNLVIGRRSDRWRSRIPVMCASAAVMATGWALVGFTDVFWLALLVYAALLSAPYGVLNAQIFAGLADVMAARDEPRPSTVNSTLRGGYSFGFMIGPVLSTALASVAGIRAAFAVAAVAYAGVAILALFLDSTRPAATTAGPRSRGGGNLPLTLFAVGTCLVIVGDMLRGVYLPVYVVEELHHSTFVFGVLIAAVAGAEVVVFPLVGMAADRFGIRRIIAVALAVGVCGYAVLATSTQLWQVVVFHVFQVFLFAATIALGLSYAQRLVPGRPGTASAAFFSAQTAAKPVSGLLGAVAVAGLGLPGLFWLPAVLCALCLAAFTAASLRARSRPVPQPG
ncbi:MFS transporter [Stackebrandtia albiflava]|nr:MFS transporter [Stackebrandtia albiflava]